MQAKFREIDCKNYCFKFFKNQMSFLRRNLPCAVRHSVLCIGKTVSKGRDGLINRLGISSKSLS